MWATQRCCCSSAPRDAGASAGLYNTRFPLTALRVFDEDKDEDGDDGRRRTNNLLGLFATAATSATTTTARNQT